MATDTAQQVADKSPASDAQARRAEQLRKAYQRELRHRPTTIQRGYIDAAAVATAKSEFASLDASVSANDYVRLFNMASRARAEMFASFAAKPVAVSTPSLSDLLREAAPSTEQLLANHRASHG